MQTNLLERTFHLQTASNSSSYYIDFVLKSNKIIITKSEQQPEATVQKSRIIELYNTFTAFSWKYNGTTIEEFYFECSKEKRRYTILNYRNQVEEIKKLISGRVIEKNFKAEYEIQDCLFRKSDSQVLYKVYQIYVIKHRHTQKLYISKFIQQSSYNEEVNTNLMLNEIRIFFTLKQNPNKYIVKCKRVFYENKSVIFVMPYLRGGTVYHLIQERNLMTFQKKKLIKQIILGINHLHQLGIIHRDIKLDNILIKKKNKLLINIIDFGYSVFIRDQPLLITKCGTPGYVAPEIYQSDCYDQKCDIYSLGHVAHMIETGQRIFSFNLTTSELIQMNSTNQFALSKKIMNNQTTKHFILSMLSTNPHDRPSALECLDHDYFHDLQLSTKVTKLKPIPFKNPFSIENKIIQTQINS